LPVEEPWVKKLLPGYVTFWPIKPFYRREKKAIIEIALHKGFFYRRAGDLLPLWWKGSPALHSQQAPGMANGAAPLARVVGCSRAEG
jgi:hypothetical protein